LASRVDDEAAAAAVLEEAVDGVGEDGALPVLLFLRHVARDELGPVVHCPSLVHQHVVERCVADEDGGAGSDGLDGAWPGRNLLDVHAGRVQSAYWHLTPSLGRVSTRMVWSCRR